MSRQFKDEIIQLSFGSGANAVTAHSLNLQGLACTAANNNGNCGMKEEEAVALCDPYVTHDSSDGLWVPRVLFFDESDQFTLQNTKDSFQLDFHQPPKNNNNDKDEKSDNDVIITESFDRRIATNKHDLHLSSWGGSTEVLTSHAYQSNNDTSGVRLEDAYQSFQNAASVLSSSSHSRYYNHNTNTSTSYNSNNHSNDRHMNWDDLEEEEEEEEEWRRTKERMERQQWNQQEQQLRHEMNSAWNDIITYTDSDAISNGKTNSCNNNLDNNNNLDASSSLTNNDDDNDNNNSQRKKKRDIPWRCYWMPPHPKSYAVEIPSNTNFFQNESSYWREEVVSEKIRKLLEQCNLVSGFQVTLDTTNTYFYSGLTISILQELHQECKSSSIFSTIIHDDGEKTHHDNTNHIHNKHNYWRSENNVVQSFRSSLHTGLTYHGIVEYSDLALPLSLSRSYHAMYNSNNSNKTNDDTPTVFESSAGLALALEASTLPFRICVENDNKKSHIGIQSAFFQGSRHSDDDPFAHANQLSFHEYIAFLRCPSNRHVMLDMSASFHQPQSNNNNDLYSKLSMGTSIERRRLEQERENYNRNRYYSNNNYYRRTRARDVDPGLWMEDITINPDGLLTTLSPTLSSSSSSSKNTDYYLDRSLHRHFAISSSLRPSRSNLVSTTYNTFDRSNIVVISTQMMMEGMGIRHRPEVTLGTALHQSIHDLTTSDIGSYWNSSILPTKELSLLATVSNSTRIYPHLNNISKQFSDSLSRKYSGYMTRDVMSNILPEREDCLEAYEHSMDLKDLYEPPVGSGLVQDTEGQYFDEEEND